MKTTLLLVCLGLSTALYAQDLWISVADFAGSPRQFSYAISIGSKGYCGLGNNTNYTTYYNDFWEWDPVTDAWTQKASFPGAARGNLAGFSIGTKGYVGTGAYATSQTNYVSFNDFYEYNPATDTWTAKASFPGTARYDAVGFSIGNKGYVGLGYDGSENFSDFYEFDPVINNWSRKSDFPGGPRRNAVAFAIGTKGYVGTGYPNANDFWEYNPLLDTWTQKTSFEGTARHGAVGFSINGKGYIGTGYDTAYHADFWEWDPATDAWSARAGFGGAARVFGAGFSIGNKGYIGTGQTGGSFTNSRDFWEYSPVNVGSEEETSPAAIQLYPNPFSFQAVLYSGKQLHNATLTVDNCFGQTVARITNISGQTVIIPRNNLACGLYLVRLMDENNILTTVKMIITDH